MRLAAALAAAALLAAAGASTARADGDPASDFLLQQQIFFPYDAKIPQPAQQALAATVRSANKQGFKIRVALIWSDYDLGVVTSLWKQPQRYVRFLGAELTYYYKGRLLVVMPNGFGFNWPKHGSASAYHTLAGVTVDGSTPAGLTASATDAVRKLAAAAGVTATASGTVAPPAQQNSHDRVLIVVAVLVALLIGVVARFLIRRRAAAR